MNVPNGLFVLPLGSKAKHFGTWHKNNRSVVVVYCRDAALYCHDGVDYCTDVVVVLFAI